VADERAIGENAMPAATFALVRKKLRLSMPFLEFFLVIVTLLTPQKSYKQPPNKLGG
jgi:hypothetical protein